MTKGKDETETETDENCGKLWQTDERTKEQK